MPSEHEQGGQPPAPGASASSSLATVKTSSSDEYQNPLADLQENNRYENASAEARARVRADHRSVDAIDEADRCYRNEGYPDLPDQTNAAVVEVAEISALYNDGAMPEDEARHRLEAIAEHEARLQAAFEMCDLPRLATERAIYLEYFDAIVVVQLDSPVELEASSNDVGDALIRTDERTTSFRVLARH